MRPFIKAAVAVAENDMRTVLNFNQINTARGMLSTNPTGVHAFNERVAGWVQLLSMHGLV